MSECKPDKFNVIARFIPAAFAIVFGAILLVISDQNSTLKEVNQILTETNSRLVTARQELTKTLKNISAELERKDRQVDSERRQKIAADIKAAEMRSEMNEMLKAELKYRPK
jgi:long-subunit acyl-CoA synthetase (AMP-forming)